MGNTDVEELKRVGTRVTDSGLTERNVGGIFLETMAFTGYSGDLRLSTEIVIKSVKHGNEHGGYGTDIFRGSLEELIAKLAPIATPLEAAPEPSVKG